MTIGELILALMEFPEDSIVKIYKGRCHETHEDVYLDLDDFYSVEVTEDGEVFL